MSVLCPFCGADPYDRTSYGEPVAITCCEPMIWFHETDEENEEIRKAVERLIADRADLWSKAENLIERLERIQPGIENSNSAAEDAMVEILPDVLAALREIQP